jgi:hypothetical protein
VGLGQFIHYPPPSSWERVTISAVSSARDSGLVETALYPERKIGPPPVKRVFLRTLVCLIHWPMSLRVVSQEENLDRQGVSLPTFRTLANSPFGSVFHSSGILWASPEVRHRCISRPGIVAILHTYLLEGASSPSRKILSNRLRSSKCDIYNLKAHSGHSLPPQTTHVVIVTNFELLNGSF